MAFGLNRVELIGRLGADVTVSHAESYLRARGLSRCRFAALRFHPELRYRERSTVRRFPALVAAVTGDGGAITGVQRTWLDSRRPAKAGVAVPRKALGRIHGLAVRFGAPSDLAPLVVGEGIETVLSLVTAVPEITAAAALSAGSLGAFAPPPGLARLVIAQDNDEDGALAAQRLARRCARAGVVATLIVPVGNDFNDDLVALGSPRHAAKLHQPPVAAVRARVPTGHHIGDRPRTWNPIDKEIDMNTIDNIQSVGDDREPEHAASATAMACEAAALYGATPGPDEFDNRPLWEAEPHMKTRPHGELTFAEKRTRRIEYKVRSDQDPNLHPGDPLDLPDLRAAFEDSHLPAIVHEIIDLAAERLCADGTKLADERESMIWGLVNCFHAQTQRLDRALDRIEPELRDLQRAQDGTEIKSRELEMLTDKAHNTADRRDALEIFRDCAADAYRARTGDVWRPRHGSHASRTGSLTSAAIDARDFMRARKDRKTQAHLPEGTLVAIAGGKDVQDPAAVIERLDKAREKYADMVLVHGGGPGVEKIAASWAERNGVHQIVCKPDWDRHGRAAPFRRNDELLNLLPKGVIAFPGSGITENLVDKARQLGIPVARCAA